MRNKGLRQWWRPISSTDFGVVEGNHLRGYVLQMVFNRKMPRLQAVHFSLGQILQICLPAFRSEEDIALPPEDDGFWLALLQEFLPFRIEIDVRSVVIE